MDQSAALLLAAFILSLPGLFVFIGSMTRGLFGTVEDAMPWQARAGTPRRPPRSWWPERWPPHRPIQRPSGDSSHEA